MKTLKRFFGEFAGMGFLKFTVTLSVFALIGASFYWLLHNHHWRPFSTSSVDSKVLVKVGDESILKEDLDFEYKLSTAHLDSDSNLKSEPDFGAATNADKLSALKSKILADLIEQKVVLAYAKRDRGFDILKTMRGCREGNSDSLESDAHDTRPLDIKDRTCEKSAIKSYLQEMIFSKVTIEDTAVQEYYQNNAPLFKENERVTVRQIVLPDEKSARRLRNKVTRANFSAMAREHSITPEALTGGKLGPFARGEMPNVFDVAFKMRRRAISPVLKSPYGFHIIILDQVDKARVSGYDEVVESIRTKLEKALSSIEITDNAH
jgi:hypothetical protein